MTRKRWLLAGVGAVVALAVAGGVSAYVLSSAQEPMVTPAASAPSSSGPSSGPPYAFRRLESPNRTEVVDSAGQPVAVFTDGARTVRLTGPNRVFAEPAFTQAKVGSNAWVRLAPQEWHDGGENEPWFSNWLPAALADSSPDVLAVAFQYVQGAERQRNGEGLQMAGDAAFGPLSDNDADGRAENSDFYDYLGVSWTFRDGTKEAPSRERLRSLDCSGFLRMVFGYRLGYPLLGTNDKGLGIPRRAFAIAAVGPGVQLVPNTGGQVRELGLLQPGDLVFFHGSPETDTDTASNSHIEHAGIYLGVDDRGHHRFISSRTTANGPTMGDAGGAAILDGSGHFAKRLRTMRRL